MPTFKVRIQFKGDKTYYIQAEDENEAQDKALSEIEYDIPDATYIEVVKVEPHNETFDD